VNAPQAATADIPAQNKYMYVRKSWIHQ